MASSIIDVEVLSDGALVSFRAKKIFGSGSEITFADWTHQLNAQDRIAATFLQSWLDDEEEERRGVALQNDCAVFLPSSWISQLDSLTCRRLRLPSDVPYTLELIHQGQRAGPRI